MSNNLKTITIIGIGVVCLAVVAVLGLHTVPKLVETVANSEVE